MNGSRCYSADLPQGGLEIPCILKFMAKIRSEAAKTEILLISALNIRSTGISEDSQMMTSSSESGSDVVQDDVAVLEVYDVVLKSEAIARPTVDLTEYSADSPSAKKQKTFDMEKIIMEDELSDGEINYAQRLLKMKHPGVGGL